MKNDWIYKVDYVSSNIKGRKQGEGNNLPQKHDPHIVSISPIENQN